MLTYKSVTRSPASLAASLVATARDELASPFIIFDACRNALLIR